jgi:DNA polymerase I
MMGTQTSASDNIDFQLFLRIADQCKYLHVDTESNGQPIKDGRGHAIGMSIDVSPDGLNAYSYYFPFRHQTPGNLDFSYRDELKKLIEDPNKVKISHNTRFDILSARTLGIEYGMNFEDTMLLTHNVNENLFSYSLDSVAKGLGYDGKARDKHFDKLIKLFGWDGITPDRMAEYAGVDSSLLRPIFEHYKPIYDLEDDSHGELWENDKKFMIVLNDMEQLGARVDLNLAEQEIERGEKVMQELTNDIGLNPGSHSQLSELLFNRLGIPVNDRFRSKKTGKPSLDKKAMEYYEDQLEALGSPVAKQVLEYRGYQKAVSSYWKAYIEHVSPDGRIRPNFNLHRTLTNRLSCDTPNLQQIPRITAKPWNRLVKSGFIPEDGFEIWEADYSQLEMRLTAAYAQQQSLIDIFADPDRDLFTEMSLAMGLPRDPIKTGVYATGYGAGVDKLATIFGSHQLAQKFKDEYYSNYPGIRKATNLATATAKGQGYVRMWSYRRRHFADVGAEAHKAFNSVIQGGASDIVKRVMIRLHENVHNVEECRMILQVHDSVWFEIRKDKIDHYRREITNIMEDVRPDFGVKFKIDFHKLGS